MSVSIPLYKIYYYATSTIYTSNMDNIVGHVYMLYTYTRLASQDPHRPLYACARSPKWYSTFLKIAPPGPKQPTPMNGLVYWGLTPQQQPGSYQGGEMMMKSVFLLWSLEETGVPGGNHRPGTFPMNVYIIVSDADHFRHNLHVQHLGLPFQ